MFILRKFLHQNGSNYFLIIVLLEGSVVIYYETLISGNHGIQIKSSGEIAELALTPSTNLFDQGRDSDFDEFMANTKVDIARKIYGKLINKE